MNNMPHETSKIALEVSRLAQEYREHADNGKFMELEADDLLNLTVYFQETGQVLLAMATAQQGCRRYPGHTGLMVQKAYLLMEEDCLKEARKLACQMNDHSVEAQVLRASILIHEDMSEEAEKLLAPIAEVMDMDSICEIAHAYMYLEDYETAGGWIQKIKPEDRNDAEVLCTLGTFFRLTGNTEKSLKVFEKMARQHFVSPFYNYRQAVNFFELGMYTEAIDAAGCALLGCPQNGLAHLLQAKAFDMLKNHNKALTHYLNAVRFYALAKDEFHYIEASHLIYNEQWDKAEEHLHKMMEIKENGRVDGAGRCDLMALCLIGQNKMREAMSYCKLAQEMDPNNVEYLFTESKIYLAVNKQEEVYHTWNKIIKLDNSMRSFMEIAQICTSYGLDFEARNIFRELENAEPKDPLLYDYMANCYLAMTDTEEFLRCNALSSHPFTVEEVINLREEERRKHHMDYAARLGVIINKMMDNK